ncbi:MAG: hypothetical protein Q8O89_03065 [Nanoarchaeota archaeon]|nr:hypothetical protein [Nanoarchaeota archaeon]
MPLNIDDIKGIHVFNGDSGLCLNIFSNRDANCAKELSSIVNSLDSFYTREYAAQINKSQIPADDNSGFLYRVFQNKQYFATVKITPKGVEAKPRKRAHEDYPIADPTTYTETYFMYFFPQDKTKRSEHREAYLKFIDPSRTKTF